MNIPLTKRVLVYNITFPSKIYNYSRNICCRHPKIALNSGQEIHTCNPKAGKPKASSYVRERSCFVGNAVGDAS